MRRSRRLRVRATGTGLLFSICTERTSIFSSNATGKRTRLRAQARQRFEALGIPSRRMLSLVILGRISLSLNDTAAAQKNTEEIAAITEQERIPLLRFPYFVLCGQIAERKQDWARAEESFRLAAEDLETHQSRLQHDDLKVTFLRGRNQVYESLVRLGLENSREPVETAYSWCERAKSRGLVELLSHHLPSVQLRGEQSLLRRVHRLREELNLQYVRSRPETGCCSVESGIRCRSPQRAGTRADTTRSRQRMIPNTSRCSR